MWWQGIESQSVMAFLMRYVLSANERAGGAHRGTEFARIKAPLIDRIGACIRIVRNGRHPSGLRTISDPIFCIWTEPEKRFPIPLLGMIRELYSRVARRDAYASCPSIAPTSQMIEDSIHVVPNAPARTPLHLPLSPAQFRRRSIGIRTTKAPS